MILRLTLVGPWLDTKIISKRLDHKKDLLCSYQDLQFKNISDKEKNALNDFYNIFKNLSNMELFEFIYNLLKDTIYNVEIYVIIPKKITKKCFKNFYKN